MSVVIINRSGKSLMAEWAQASKCERKKRITLFRKKNLTGQLARRGDTEGFYAEAEVHLVSGVEKMSRLAGELCIALISTNARQQRVWRLGASCFNPFSGLYWSQSVPVTRNCFAEMDILKNAFVTVQM